ncbi:MAG: trypsin-like serine protease [Myxococcales bacterium]|nr:trypsin-like serine protease [Myxococcales bacterium]
MGVVVGSLTLLPCDYAHASDGPGAFSLAPQQSEIYGGEPTDYCEWPTTAFLGGCTGTLVHPQMIIYAAHCGAGIGQIRLGESGNSPERILNPEYCRVNPGGGPGQGNDWAYCKLQEPVLDVPIVPPLMGCETSVLQPGKEVALVGFGNTDDNTFGIKYEVFTTINSITPQDEAHIGGGGLDTCQGDSGGPVYVQLSEADNSWRVFGITSYGGACGGGGYYSMMHTGMEWFESDSGLDITPCHNADGTWNPGPDCKGFQLEPEVGHGSWADGCSGGPTSGLNSICGDPFDVGPADTPPIVNIINPMDGETFTTDGGNQPMTIEAEAMDDGAVQYVELVINDKVIDGSADYSAPYQWPVQMPTGQYYISARAVDFTDAEGFAPPIAIGVNADAPEPDPTTTGSDSDSDSGTDSGTDGGTSDSGTDGTSAGPGDDDDDDDDNGTGSGTDSGSQETGGSGEGCGCRSGDGGGPLTPALLGLALLGLTRRRRG